MDDGPANIVIVPASIVDASFSTDDVPASIVGECSTAADASFRSVDAPFSNVDRPQLNG